MGKKILLIFRI